MVTQIDRIETDVAPQEFAVFDIGANVRFTVTDTTARVYRKVCEMAFGAFYRCFAPALGLFDGDLVATLATGQVKAHVHQVGVMAERILAEAIVRAVREADGFGLLPAVSDLSEA